MLEFKIKATLNVLELKQSIVLPSIGVSIFISQIVALATIIIVNIIVMNKSLFVIFYMGYFFIY